MIKSPSFTNAQNKAIREFNTLHIRALWNSWLSKIFIRKNNLKSFVGSNVTGVDGRSLTGIQRIRVDKIVGTIRRTEDYDLNFRPLKNQLRDHWVNTLLKRETHGWQPILVHKVGEHYYVADGLHQVSVAHAVGMEYIEVKVWDHSSCQISYGACAPQQRALPQCTKSFLTN